MKHELTRLAKIVKHNPLNCIARQKFNVLKKVYKRLLKQKQKEYVSSIWSQLSLAFSKDPKSFRQAIKNLKNDNISDCPPVSAIDNSAWFDYFSKLYAYKPDPCIATNNMQLNEEQSSH